MRTTRFSSVLQSAMGARFDPKTQLVFMCADGPCRHSTAHRAAKRQRQRSPSGVCTGPASMWKYCRCAQGKSLQSLSLWGGMLCTSETFECLCVWHLRLLVSVSPPFWDGVELVLQGLLLTMLLLPPPLPACYRRAPCIWTPSCPIAMDIPIRRHLSCQTARRRWRGGRGPLLSKCKLLARRPSQHFR